jgi:DNA-binding FrmR family transcriptional regulator
MNEKAEENASILMRLRRIEGQLRGLQRMVEEEKPCSQVLTQVAAVTAAMKRVGTAIIQCHMGDCLEVAAQKAGTRQRESLRDFQKAMSRYIDFA